MGKKANVAAVVNQAEQALAVVDAMADRRNSMAEIKSFVFVRHLRAEPTTHVLFFKNGDLRASGRGLALWF